MPTDDKPKKNPKEQARAEALRANLMKRKQQTRARDNNDEEKEKK